MYYITGHTISCMTFVLAVTCGNDQSSQSGSISSPNYPQNYSDNLLCVWTITVPSGNVYLNVSEMDIGSAMFGCGYDGLLVSRYLIRKQIKRDRNTY